MKKHALLVAMILSGIASTANAHYPWLAKSSDGKAILFFGETPADRTYKLPQSIAGAKVFTDSKAEQPIEVVATESDDLIGLVSKEPVAKDASLISKVTFGIYHGTKLDYYVQHQGGALPSAKPSSADAKGLHACAVDTDKGVDVFVHFNGKPTKHAEVKLYCQEGHEEAKATTDEDGKVSFTDKEVEEGLNAILVGKTEENAGELDGKSYKTESHYLTLTFEGS